MLQESELKNFTKNIEKEKIYKFQYVEILHMINLTMLQLKALWIISKKSCHGYELMEKLKTNQGTIYPLLNSLEKEGLVNSVSKGRKREYNITNEGKKTLKKSCIEFCEIYNDIFEKYICGKCGYKNE